MTGLMVEPLHTDHAAFSVDMPGLTVEPLQTRLNTLHFL